MILCYIWFITGFTVVFWGIQVTIAILAVKELWAVVENRALFQTHQQQIVELDIPYYPFSDRLIDEIILEFPGGLIL